MTREKGHTSGEGSENREGEFSIGFFNTRCNHDGILCVSFEIEWVVDGQD